MDCNLPGSSVHEIFQARTLEWENKMAEEPGKLQSMGLQKSEHDLAAKQQQTTKFKA